MSAAGATAYFWGLSHPEAMLGGHVAEARSATVWTLLFVGLWVLVELSRPLTRRRTMLVASMAAAAGVLTFVPYARDFFALPAALPGATVAVVFIVEASVIAIEVGLFAVGWRPVRQESGS
jgi:hypothetical protein